MDTAKSKHALEKVAKRNGVSLETVKQEIDLAIDQALETSDPKIKEFWDSIPKAGEKVTPEELVAYLSGQIANRK